MTKKSEYQYIGIEQNDVVDSLGTQRLLNEKSYLAWHKDYIDALISRNLRDIANIKRKGSILKLIEVLSAWSSKFMDLSSIGSNLSLARPTLGSYINALEVLYITERVRNWHNTDYDGIGKQEKLFRTDTGMMAAMQHWRFGKACLDGSINGKLLETFIFNQLSAHIDNHHHQYQLTHYRVREKREMDFVIEREDGAILGLEVKASSVVDKTMFKYLHWFQHNIVKQQPFVGIVLYTGEHIVSFGPNF